MTNPAIRLEFKKFGGLKYISHLDLQRAILRFVKRAHLPIRYTEGFNPHPKIVFALTMSVGMESVSELVDIYLKRDEENPEEPVITPEEFAKRLSKILPNGLEIVSASFPEKDFSQIESADYTITLIKNDSAQLSDFIKNAFLSPVEILKKTKSGEKLVNISPLVFSVSTEENDKECRVFARLSAKPNEYLSPDLFVKALCQYDNGSGIDSWQVIREKINFKES